MDCPACKNAMITLELEDVEIDYCTDCGGIWLDAGELELLVGKAQEAKQLLDSFKVDTHAGEKPRKCPICLKKMQKIIVGPSTPVLLIDKCPRGDGLWFDKGELQDIFNRARLDKDGFLIESAEMRLIRQTLMHIRSLDMVVLPEESAFLEQIQLGCVLVIRNLWSNESVTIEKAVELSNWVWRNIAPSPLEWVKSLREPQNIEKASEAFAHHHSFLVKPMNLSLERYDAFLKWLEDDIFASLLSANSDLIDTLSDIVSKDIKHMVEDICSDENGIDG